jgi:hypothetical protein
LLALVVLWAMSAPTRAGALALGGTTVGTLSTEGPFAVPNDFVAGVNFWANWSLDPLQTKVDSIFPAGRSSCRSRGVSPCC